MKSWGPGTDLDGLRDAGATWAMHSFWPGQRPDQVLRFVERGKVLISLEHGIFRVIVYPVFARRIAFLKHARWCVRMAM